MSCAGKKEDSKTDIPVVQEEPSGPSPYPINDEFGVPMLELSSDSDTVRINTVSVILCCLQINKSYLRNVIKNTIKFIQK